ncbi:hypothetical protein AOLI_G00007030 [Acnodon oligacanthus]
MARAKLYYSSYIAASLVPRPCIVFSSKGIKAVMQDEVQMEASDSGQRVQYQYSATRWKQSTKDGSRNFMD